MALTLMRKSCWENPCVTPVVAIGFVIICLVGAFVYNTKNESLKQIEKL